MLLFRSIKSLWVPLFIVLMLLTGCDIANLHKPEVVQASNEPIKNYSKEVTSNTEVASIQHVKTEEEIEVGIEEEGIEEEKIPFNQAFLAGIENGTLLDIELPLGTTREELLAARGEPISLGSYEGGNFYEYDDVTFFINPETDKVVAIAKPIKEMKLTMEDIKYQLGSPDFEGMNEMDGLWMMEYEHNGKIVIFESWEEEGNVEFVWLRERL